MDTARDPRVLYSKGMDLRGLQGVSTDARYWYRCTGCDGEMPYLARRPVCDYCGLHSLHIISDRDGEQPKFLDHCSVCSGARGGIQGKEIMRPDGSVICVHCEARERLRAIAPLGQVSGRHRHRWIVMCRSGTPSGREKEMLRCQNCKASKGRFVRLRPRKPRKNAKQLPEHLDHAEQNSKITDAAGPAAR